MTQGQRNKKKAEQLRLAAQIIETGAEWEIERVGMGWLDSGHIQNCQWGSPLDAINHGFPIRIKPSGQIKPWKLPDPPAGRKWHRNDWTQDMLPDGWRPLLDGEIKTEGDQVACDDCLCWVTMSKDKGTPLKGFFYRTRRPLPEPVIPVPESWRELRDDEKDGRWIEGAKYLENDGTWEIPGIGCYAVLGYRIIVPVAKPRVPLEPGDVPPGSVIRPIKRPDSVRDCWAAVISIGEIGIQAVRSGDIEGYSYSDLMTEFEIKRPTDTEWQPCSKEAP